MFSIFGEKKCEDYFAGFLFLEDDYLVEILK